jgi:hypothetical protein
MCRIDTEAAALSDNLVYAQQIVDSFSCPCPSGHCRRRLAATEVHKLVMRSLRDLAKSPLVFDELFAVSHLLR